MKGVREVYNLWLPFEEKESVLKTLKKVDAPKSDNDYLINYQYEYLINKNEGAFLKMWILFTKICLKIVKKQLKERCFYCDKESLEYKADVACEYVLRRYKKYDIDKNEYYVISNFIAAAYDGVQHALSEEENDKALDNAISFEDVEVFI